MKIRLNKYLALAGVASRREADRMISEGRVSVNGETAEMLGIQVDEVKDKVAVDGKIVKPMKSDVYLMLNKPPGYLVTAKDPFLRPTITDLLPAMKNRIFPVGRLDFDSEGLLLLTNDGDLANRLMHPSYQVIKEYRIRVRPKPDLSTLATLEKGISLDGKKTAPAKFRILTTTVKGTLLMAKLHEGRKRELRRMFECMGFRVIALKRVKLGSLHLGPLKKGKWRHLKREEVIRLKKKVGLG
ncbi:MAG: rRNA pseudouridine synthase [Candidatus Aminicenantes bacterium]|nr:MAG: rRNA pseudouridine synthase [Candidatus Aminicenantes bacterium]